MLKVTQLVSGRSRPPRWFNLTLLSLTSGCSAESLLSTCCVLLWRRAGPHLLPWCVGGRWPPDIGRTQAGEEPWQVYGRALGAIRWGQHLREGSVTTGRASNAAGSCSPEQSTRGSGGFASAERHLGSVQDRASRGREQERHGSPCSDEPSFLPERKVSRGDGRSPRPSQCSLVTFCQLAA